MISGRLSQTIPQTKKVKWGDTTVFLFLLMIFLMITYRFIVTGIYLYFHYLMAFLLLTVAYGYAYWIIYHCSELLSMTIRNMAKRNVAMRKTSHTLIYCRNLDTFVLDGRDANVHMKTIKIDSEKLKKNYNKMVYICSYIIDISVLSISRV